MSAITTTRRNAALTIADINKLYADGTRIAMLTAYDYPTAKLVDEAGIPLILVGDSLATVMLGYEATMRVTVDQMLHHTGAVVRGAQARAGHRRHAVPVLRDARRGGRECRPLPQEAGAQAVKMEGGVRSARQIEAVVKAGIPVMGAHRLDAPVEALRWAARSASRARPRIAHGRSSPTRSRSRKPAHLP